MAGIKRTEEELRELAEQRRKLERELSRITRRRDTRIRRGVAAGVPKETVARWAGVSRGRVGQIASAAQLEVARRSSASSGSRSGAQRGDWARVEPYEPPAPPALTVTQGSTRRAARWAELAPLFVGVTPRLTLDDTLRQAIKHAGPAGSTSTVYLCGPRPGTGDAPGMRAWLLNPPEGWRITSAWISDATTPVVRYEQPATGVKVSIYRAAAWFGEGDYSAAAAGQAWRLLDTFLRDGFGQGAGMRATPATTGRDLWSRTIPHGREWPVMHAELRELIAATSGQGRIELLPPAAEKLPDGLVQYDARLAYAALVWGMPVGEPTWHEKPAPDEWRALVQKRGRWLVQVTVPSEWAHVGLLPCRDVGDAWCYPREPGERFRTWVDAEEARLAIKHGWLLVPERGVTWAEGKPLNAWRDALVTGYAAMPPLVAAGVRSIVLHTIGGFAQRRHPVTHAVSRAEDVPTGARDVSQVSRGVFVYTSDATGSPEAAAYAHPEWSATVWARARCRLLDAPAQDGQRVGALHVPFRDVVALRTDALYLATDPEWSDTGAIGAYRRKHHQPGPLAWPTTTDELLELT